MKYFAILLILVGISLSYSNLPDAEARTIAPLHIALEDETIKQNSFIIADGGVPVITIKKGETVSFPFTVSPRISEPLPVNFFYSIESTMPDTRKSTLPNMKIEFEPFYMILNPDESQMMNVTITTLNYTQLGEHKVTVIAQYPQGEPLLNTRFDVLVVDENQFVKSNDDFKYPVPGGGIIAHLYSLKIQIESGLSYDELRCNEGHVLIQKYDGSPACVTEQTKTKLIERGWTGNKKYQDNTTVQLTTFGSQPSWSPDGKQLVFVKNAPYGQFTSPDEIWIINADGSDPHSLTKIPEHTTASSPKFSPDGKKIAFISDYGCSDCHSRNYLSVMDSDGGYKREIADGGYNLEFVWSADNKIILARVNNETHTNLFQIDPVPNSEPEFLTQLPLNVNGWNIIINNAGTKLLFTGLDYYYNSQLYSLDLSNNNMKTIPGTDGLFLVSLSKDEQTIFATDDSRSNSFTLYAIDAKNMTKTQLSYGYVGYTIHENTGTGSDIRIASGYYPGGVVSYDKEQMSKIGIYVNTENTFFAHAQEMPEP